MTVTTIEQKTAGDVKLHFTNQFKKLFYGNNFSKNYSMEKGYSSKGLTFFKELLTEKIKVAESDLTVFLRVTTVENTQTAELGESSAAGVSNEFREFGMNRQKKYISELKNALLRITQFKTYGRCTVTQEYIDPDRLFATPHCTMSMGAKKAIRRN